MDMRQMTDLLDWMENHGANVGTFAERLEIPRWPDLGIPPLADGPVQEPDGAEARENPGPGVLEDG